MDRFGSCTDWYHYKCAVAGKEIADLDWSCLQIFSVIVIGMVCANEIY